MKKIISIIIIITMLLTSGCSVIPEPPGNPLEICNIVLIIDKTRYAPKYDFEMLLGDEISKYYCKKQDKITVICPDGSGNPTSKTFVFKGTNKKVGQSSMKRVIAKENAKVFEYVNEMKPVEAELNLIPALSMAASELASDDKAVGRVYLVTGGLTTVAPLDMKSSLSIDASSTIRNLLTRDMLPDFKGASIDVYGLGYVAQGTAQSSLGSAEKKHLTAFYEELLKASNATCMIHSNTPDSDISAIPTDELPYVTPVDVSSLENLVDLEEDNMQKGSEEAGRREASATTIDPSKEIIEFPPETLNYKPGSDEFLLSEEMVAEILTPIKEWYCDHPNKLYIFSGTASCGSERELMNLSARRGNAVKEVLISLGVNADDLIVVPIGYSKNPYRTVDTVNGVFDEEAAMKNRITYVMSEGNPAMKDFQDALKN